MITLAQVIAKVESSGNPCALRFEPTVYRRFGIMEPNDPDRYILNKIQKVHDCDHMTACMIAGTSWGLFQILGENLWSLSIDYQGTLFDYCMSATNQKACFKSMLTMIHYPFPPSVDFSVLTGSDMNFFATRYNGGGNNLGYIAAMKTAYESLTKGGTP